MRVRHAGRGHSRPISVIAFLEELAILGHVDGLARGADQLHAVLLEHALATRSSAVFSAVCPPMVGSSASGFSFSMMRRHRPPVDRLDVDARRRSPGRS